jgi:Na+/H+ antiporter NhaD/arsenite permease-like protein
MTVAVASSAGFVTPVASPVNTLVSEPGGYAFMDFVKAGLPLLFLTLVTTILLAAVIYLLQENQYQGSLIPESFRSVRHGKILGSKMDRLANGSLHLGYKTLWGD